MRFLVLLLVAVASAAAFHEKFDAGWESRFVHSADDKYSGKFVVEGGALKASLLAIGHQLG